MTELKALIERVERATGPDREIDARVWCAVQGYEFSAMKNEHSFKYAPYRDALRASLLWGHQLVKGEHYTSSLDAVIALIEQQMPGAEWSLTNLYGTAWAELPLNGGDMQNEGDGCHGRSPILAAWALHLAGSAREAFA